MDEPRRNAPFSDMTSGRPGVVPRRRLAVGVTLGVLCVAGCAPDLAEREVDEAPSTVKVTTPAELRRLSLDVVLTLGHDGPGAGPLGRIAVSPDTSIFAVTDVFRPHEVHLYGSTGEHLMTLGRRGDGPGEFRNIIFLTAVGDSLFVYDNSHGRETVYTFDGTYHRSRPLTQNLWRALPLPGGTAVVNGYDPAPGRSGAPLHLVVEGQGTWSFPAPAGPFEPRDRPFLRRALAAESDSAFWAAAETAYGIELWGVPGTRIVTLERDADWFVPHDEAGVILPNVPPAPRIRDLHRSPDGLLWVLLHVADSNWRNQFDPERPADMAFTGNFHGYRDSVLEAIELETGRLVASERFPTYFSGFTSAGHVAAYHEPAGGPPYIEIRSIRLREP